MRSTINSKNKKLVCVSYVNDEYGEFWIFRELNENKILPKSITDKFTGKNITIPKNALFINKFIVNRKSYLIAKKYGEK